MKSGQAGRNHKRMRKRCSTTSHHAHPALPSNHSLPNREVGEGLGGLGRVLEGRGGSWVSLCVFFTFFYGLWPPVFWYFHFLLLPCIVFHISDDVNKKYFLRHISSTLRAEKVNKTPAVIRSSHRSSADIQASPKWTCDRPDHYGKTKKY